jgi:hypothetical protein
VLLGLTALTAYLSNCRQTIKWEIKGPFQLTGTLSYVLPFLSKFRKHIFFFPVIQIQDVNTGSRNQKFSIPDPGSKRYRFRLCKKESGMGCSSRIPGSKKHKKHRITDPQHCFYYWQNFRTYCMLVRWYEPHESYS